MTPTLDFADPSISPASKSLSPTECIVPIAPTRTQTLKDIEGLAVLDSGVSLAFAMTYHKIQGQAMKKVILDLNLCPSMRLTTSIINGNGFFSSHLERNKLRKRRIKNQKKQSYKPFQISSKFQLTSSHNLKQ